MPPGAAAVSDRQLAKLRSLAAAKRQTAPGRTAPSSVNSDIDGSLIKAGLSTAAGGGRQPTTSSAPAADAGSDAVQEETRAFAARLEGANSHLRERLADALDELDVAHKQLRILQGLQQQLEDATPGAADLVAAAVEQERALQGARDAQVLQLLRAKDEVIESFEARYAECRAQAAQYREALDAAQQKLENSQLRVTELVQSKQELRRQLDQAAVARADAEAALQGEVAQLKEEAAACGPLKRQVQALEGQLGDARADLKLAHQQMHTLADTVDAANAAITEVQAMLSEREEVAARKEAEAQDLQRHLAQLLGMPRDDARLVHQAQYAGSAPGEPRTPAEARIAALEAANERLEVALVEALRGSEAPASGLRAERSAADSDGDAVGELTAQLALEKGKLQAAEERVAQLEKLLKVAEATVLHNEVQLQDALEGRMSAEEQVHALRLELEDSQALLEQVKVKLAELSAAEQAAKSDAAAVRSTLAAVAQEVGILPQAPGQQQQQQQQQRPSNSSGIADVWRHVPLDTEGVQVQSGLGQEVGAAVGTLLLRISSLEQQVASQQEELATATAAAAAASKRPDCQTAAVQAARPDVARAEVQVEAAGQVVFEASSTQTDGNAVATEGAVDGGAYGRPDVQQQQVAALTAQLAAARLEAVSAKAEQAAVEARLQDAVHQLEKRQEQDTEHELQAAHCMDGTCPAAVQLRAEAADLQARVGEAESRAAAARAEGDARLAQAAADAQATQKAVQAQLGALQGVAGELRELRSSAYATVVRLRQACQEQGMVPATPPDGCEPGSLPQQLRRAADQLLAMLQEHSELVAAFQQRMQSDVSDLSQTAAAALEPAQRTVIRSLAAQVASLQLQLEQLGVDRQRSVQDRVQLLQSALAPGGASTTAACSPTGAAAWPQPLASQITNAATSADALVGMVALLKQQLASLDRIQQQLDAGARAAIPGAESAPGVGSSGLQGMPTAAHAVALLETELPSLHATVAVLEVEVRRTVAQAAPSGAATSSDAGGAALCLTTTDASDGPGSHAAVAAAEDAVRRGDKWKGRCKELQAKLASAERASAEQAAFVQGLQQRVEDLAAAGSQLEGVLQDTAQQLAQALRAADDLQAQLQQQRQQHAEAEQHGQAQLAEVQGQLAASQAALEGQQQENEALAARLEAIRDSMHSSGACEEDLRLQLQELGHQVAVLTAAQEAAKAEVIEQRQALTAAQQELGAARAAYAQLGAEKQQREEELGGRLQALQHECSTLLAVVERAEAQQTEVEERFHEQLDTMGQRLQQFGEDATADVPVLSSALGRLQQAAEELEVRLLRLEAQAAVAAEDRQEAAAARWAHLERCRRYRAAVRQLRDGLQGELLDAQAVVQRQAAQLAAVQGSLQAALGQCEELACQARDAELRHQQDLQAAALAQEHALAAAEEQAQEELQQAVERVQADAAAALAAAEERHKVELAARACQLQQRALADLETAEQQCSELQAQVDAVRAEFKRFRAVKAVEVRLLEQRVLRELCPSGSSGRADAGAGPPASSSQPGPDSLDASLDDLEVACCNDGISAALREARLERLHRQRLEGELAAAQQAEEQLRGRAKTAEQELAAAKGRHAGERERADRLAAELADCQAALRLAKAEGSRRLKELQALQRQAAGGENSGPNSAAQLEGEGEARKAAEAQVREARQALARKAELIRDLRGKVSSLERELAERDPAPLATELEACQARLRQAQAACGSKEAAVRELRERLEQQARLARQHGTVLEARQTREAAELQHLGQELAERDSQLSELHCQLKQVHHELAAATTRLQEASASHSADADSAAARLAEARQCMQQLAQAVRLLLHTLVHLTAATATQEGCSQAGADELAATAGDLATLVDLSPDDIGAVLMPTADLAGGPGSAAAVQAAARQAWDALDQLDSQAAEGGWEATHKCATTFQHAVYALSRECTHVAAALGCDGSSSWL